MLLSQFDYTYDTEGQLKTWTKNYPGLATPQRHDLGYDNADQLLTAPLKNATTNALVKQYIYGYDLASNRTSERVANKITTSTPNSVNEITSQSGGTARTLSYDLNGSLTSDGGTRTFEWDGANRLVAVNYTGTTQRTEFSYDGLNRCVKLVEKTGTTVNSTRRFVWCGTEKCEFRNASGAVQYQIFSQGQYQGTGAYVYVRDHLGSIREMPDTSGAVVARYDYDPWGRSTTVIGTNKPDFNFTGLYTHPKSGLDMATYRFYDPDLGRWLSRDPIEEEGGINLYGYVGNSPANDVDPLGLDPIQITYKGKTYSAYRYSGDMSSLKGKTFGQGNLRGECAAGAQELSGAPNTRNWRPNTPTLSELLANGVNIPSGTVFASMGGPGGRYGGGAGNTASFDHTVMFDSGGWNIRNPGFLGRLFGQKSVASIQAKCGNQFNHYNEDGSKTPVPYFFFSGGPLDLIGGSNSVPFRLVSDGVR